MLSHINDKIVPELVSSLCVIISTIVVLYPIPWILDLSSFWADLVNLLLFFSLIVKALSISILAFSFLNILNFSVTTYTTMYQVS